MTKLKQNAPVDAFALAELQRATGLDELFCNLLLQRGITTAAGAHQFFHPDLDHLHDPFLMKDMYTAVGRLNRALDQGQSILIYGDYDVDGVSSVAMMHSFLSDHSSQIQYYIPDRYREGYGISNEGIHFAIDHNIDLLLAIDCGIRAIDQVALAKKHGIDTIICDHHLPGNELPEALAILNPKQANCKYPYDGICGCGIGFKLIQALCMANQWPEESYYSLLDFVATATACDIVPLTGENRVLVHFGLQQLEQTQRHGFNALLQISQRGTPLSVSDLVFGLGPMINAAGRLGDARESVRLLLAQNETEANHLAVLLQHQNETRKSIDQRTVKEATELLQQESPDTKGIVLFQPQWHKGIVGIAASRLVERFRKPAVVLAESNGQAVGSARSIAGVDISHIIGQCAELLTTYGGHQHAAGLTLPIENVPALKEKVELLLQDQPPPPPTLPYTTLLPLNKIMPAFYQTLRRFAPFGPGNRNPVFLATNVELYDTPRLLKKRHLQFRVTQNESDPFKCIAFNQPQSLSILQEASPFNIYFNLQENNWNQQSILQLNIKRIEQTKS